MTGRQRVKIRTYLGYSDQSQGFYSRLEGSISVLTTDGEEEVICVLDDLADIETQLKAAAKRQKVHVAEDVRLAGHDEIIALWKVGNNYARRLSTLLGIAIMRYPFGAGDSAGIAMRG